MANYHLHAKIIGRSHGHYAVAAGAYRAGAMLYCQVSGQTFDYRRKRDVHRSGPLKPVILAPSWAPDWVDDREALYNAVERAEVRRDAQLLREFDLAIPRELDPEAARLLVLKWNQENFLIHNLVSDICFHSGYKGKNPHAHVLVTLRRIEPNGFARKKAVELNHRSLCQRWRESWERHCNESLRASGSEERISRLSLLEQGIPRPPQRHMGRAITAMRRRGVLKEEDFRRLLYRLEVTDGADRRGIFVKIFHSQRKPSKRYRLDAAMGVRLQRLADRSDSFGKPGRGLR